MARQKNTLSPTQVDETQFKKAVEAIYVIGIDEFARRSKVGRTSLFKYIGRNPVNKTINARINKMLDDEQGNSPSTIERTVEMAD